MSILVIGGAGFIGSNFVLDWLAADGEPVVNLDALTYAGNLRNLDAINSDARHVFVRGDIGGRALPETARTDWSTIPAADKTAFRFHHASNDEVNGWLAPGAPAFTEPHPYGPNSPYSAPIAASDHQVRGWRHAHGLRVLTTNCANSCGPYHLPETLIPLTIVNALTGNPCRGTVTRSSTRLAPGARPSQRASRHAGWQPHRRGLQGRRRHWEGQPRDRHPQNRAMGPRPPGPGRVWAARHLPRLGRGELKRTLAPLGDLTALGIDSTNQQECRSHCPAGGRRANCVHVQWPTQRQDKLP